MQEMSVQSDDVFMHFYSMIEQLTQAKRSGFVTRCSSQLQHWHVALIQAKPSLYEDGLA